MKLYTVVIIVSLANSSLACSVSPGTNNNASTVTASPTVLATTPTAAATVALASPTAPATTLATTPTAVATTAIASDTAKPKPGHWEGQPAVSFDLASNGHIENFSMTVPFGTDQNGPETCTVTLDDIAVVSHEFVFSKGGTISKSALDFLAAIGQLPTPVVTQTTDTGATIEAQRIIGTFESAVTVTGTYMIQICEDRWNVSAGELPTWKAAWAHS